MKFTLYLILVLSLIFVSCSKESEQKVKSQSTNSNKNYTIDDLIVLPTDFQTKYEIQNEEDFSYRDKKNGQLIKRIQIRITVHPSLNKSELENNLKHAIKIIYDKHKSNGISVLAYENGDNIMSAYTVAKSIFAPFGEWGKISASNKLDNYKVHINVRDAYFKLKISTFEIGSLVKIFRDKKWDSEKKDFVPAKDVALSKSINSWVEEDIIAYVQNNSSAKILDVHKEKYSDGSDFIRYKVLVSIKGKNFEGWVHSEEIR